MTAQEKAHQKTQPLRSGSTQGASDRPNLPSDGPNTTPDFSRLEHRILDLCEAVGAFIEWWGFKSIHGKIWVLLCLSTRPLHQRDIANRLSVSRSLVSGAVSELERFRLVQATDEHRQSPYRASIDIWSTITGVLRQREWMMIERIRLALEAALAESRTLHCGEQLPYSNERLRLLLRMTEIAQGLLRMLIALGSVEIPLGLGSWAEKAARLTQILRGGHGTDCTPSIR